MSRRFSALLLAGLLAVGLLAVGPLLNPSGVAARASTGWAPRAGATFNDPVGRLRSQKAISHQVAAALNHMRRGQTARLAVYSFQLRPLADSILQAHRRGVHVQVVLNDNWISTPTKRIRRVLGTNPNHSSFVVLCHGACRGGGGNLHMKVYAFSRTGRVDKVLMTGSANLTRRAENLQWNDLYTIRRAGGLYDTFVRVFNQLKRDRRVANRWVEWRDRTYHAQFYRRVPTADSARFRMPGKNHDPVFRRLRRVHCRAVDHTGIHRRTALRIIMYGWGGTRGKYLAERVAYLARQGCNIRVILSAPGRGVVRTLGAAGIPMRSADWQYPPVGKANFYSHLKVMALNGTFQDAGRREVWTGSENWSNMSFRNDELSLGIISRRVWRRYADQFNSLWRYDTHVMGLRPTWRP